MYSILSSAATGSTRCSGNTKIAYSFCRFVRRIRGYSLGKFSKSNATRSSVVPTNFTMTSHVCSALS